MPAGLRPLRTVSSSLSTLHAAGSGTGAVDGGGAGAAASALAAGQWQAGGAAGATPAHSCGSSSRPTTPRAYGSSPDHVVFSAGHAAVHLLDGDSFTRSSEDEIEGDLEICGRPAGAATAASRRSTSQMRGGMAQVFIIDTGEAFGSAGSDASPVSLDSNEVPSKSSGMFADRTLQNVSLRRRRTGTSPNGLVGDEVGSGGAGGGDLLWETELQEVSTEGF